ncbi:hypothetical protein V8J36_04190 [Frigidibacter sp. MR17.14]|uniref:hypothetical protein n=1 Tax=Frigidibacter sp. MR17.14 TaxID=3126509 RepID=UPI003012C516
MSSLAARLAARVAQSATHRLDRRFAEGRNRALEAAYRADPAAAQAAMEAAVGRGAAWFADHFDLSMSALLVLDQAHSQSGDARLEFVRDRTARYRERYWDPGLRCVDRSYDPEAHRHLPDIVATRPYQVIELMMIDAANIDLGGDPAHLMRYLRALSDGGGYGSTHIIVAGLLMRRAGCTDPGIEAMIAPEVAPVARANRATSYAGDLFAERIFVLEWLGRHDLVSPAWMARLVAAQRQDGGWRGRNVPPPGQSNQHTTSLAMAALAMFLQAERAERG